MKTNKFSFRLLRYELINALSNIFTLIFSVAFPIFMTMLFSYMFSTEVESVALSELNASLCIVMSMMVPIASMFIGHASNYSQEIENGAQERFKLFGFKEGTMLLTKLIANLIFMTIAMTVYFGLMFLVLDIAAPAPAAFITLIVFLYLLAAALFTLSHAIASLIRRFGPTFGVTMTLYFVFMTLGGMMGFSPSRFPVFLQYISKALPMYYISENMLEFWLHGAFDFLPLCLSLLGLTVASCGLLALSVWLNKKGKLRKSDKGVDWE